MKSYYYKYQKYKIKYMLHKSKNEQKFKDYINENLSDGLISIDFLHDNLSSKVKGKKFYDLVNNKEIKVYSGSKPQDLESFLHNELIDLSNGEKTVLNNIFINGNPDRKQLDLSGYIVVLDKSADNEEMKIKLTTIFEITQYESTFVANCEKFLNSKNIIIDKKFLTTRKTLKRYYLIEAIKIGFLPITQSNIINFNSLSNSNEQVLFDELQVIKQYVDESLIIITKKMLNTELNDDFCQDLKKIKIILAQIIDVTDIKTKYLANNDSIGLIEKVILSVKEARDIFYIEEIKQQMNLDPNKKFILVSADLVQCYRAIIANISTINLVLSLIRFMAIYDNKKLKFIGNPFELISSNQKIIQKYIGDENKKQIIKSILSNPIINLKRSVQFNIKYLINTGEQILDPEYLSKVAKLFEDDTKEIGVDLFSSITNNLEEKKKHMDILLEFARANIKDENDLLYVFNELSKYHQAYGLSFSHAIDNIDTFIKDNMSDNQINSEDQPVKESTWQFYIFYLTTLYSGFTLLEYIRPLAKKFYPNDFDWEQVDNLI